ncbi:MAG: SDR family NAD(P)-dependent oxidoreductase [Minwuia sp.]|uniref:SDR family NAD(P)-dependent oxidoreductase n=1 Tax=Minwuia sp. TaxID=2493630 RepID=UPI003A8AE100
MGKLGGKTVIVTGAGRGIGRECALLAAKEGAKVVVNDLGGSIEGGDHGDETVADQVVKEIKAAGGEATANGGSVASLRDCEAMVEQALDTFGGLHGIISPAGILRDTMLHKMSEEDWDQVIEVHLKGSFNVCRASINHFRNQEDGSIVLFSSTSGLIGNIGQANYGAAKMGIAGLSHIVAMEGERKNVRCNVITPSAWTRMIGTIPIKDEATRHRLEMMQKKMRPDQIAPPSVALLADDAKDVNGQIFSVRGNEIFLWSQPRPIRNMTRLEGWTVDTVLDHAMPVFRPAMTDLGNARVVFPYDPV